MVQYLDFGVVLIQEGLLTDLGQAMVQRQTFDDGLYRLVGHGFLVLFCKVRLVAGFILVFILLKILLNFPIVTFL